MAVTPSSSLSLLLSGGFGVGTTLHWLPSQCSASVLLSARPTAHTSLADTTATASRALLLESGFGLVTTCHAPVDGEVARAASAGGAKPIESSAATAAVPNKRVLFMSSPPLWPVDPWATAGLTF